MNRADSPSDDDKPVVGATWALANWIARMSLDDVSPGTLRTAKRCVLDSLGCALGGNVAPVSQQLMRLARRWSGEPTATVLCAEEFRTTPIAAGFVNAGLANALDYDDTLVGHHGSTVIPAALALGEAFHVSGTRFLEAVVAGYEVSIRCMSCLQPKFTRFSGGWDLGTLQTLGATAAASRILGLNARKTFDALGIALSTAPLPMIRKEKSLMGVRSDFKSGYGWSVQAGLEATLLAAEGFTAQDHCLDGELGFWADKGHVQLGLEGLSDRLGEGFLIEQVAFKPYPTCRFLHTSLESLEQIISSESTVPDQIERIEVATFGLLTDEYHNIPQPASFTEAQFSLPFCLALLTSRGRLTPKEFTSEAVLDPKVLALAARISVVEDVSASRQFPEHEKSTVSVFVTGRSRGLSVTTADARGTLDRPLMDEELECKFRDQASIGLTDEQSNQMLHVIHDLEKCDDICALTTPLDLNRG